MLTVLRSSEIRTLCGAQNVPAGNLGSWTHVTLTTRDMRIGWVLGLGPYLRAPVELLDFRKPSHYQGQRRFPNFVGCHSR